MPHLCRLGACLALILATGRPAPAEEADEPLTLNRKDDGYRGIWYMNQPSGDEYVYKYSGGLGTYCAKHKPFAVYCPSAHKTFFCYGGTTKDSHRRLVHMVSFFDHRTGTVPRPTILLDKQTSDAHDNPVISVDAKGYIWIFSTSHGRSRPSYIHRSREPYAIDHFVRVPATRLDGDRRAPITNFSYMQPWYVPDRGFIAFFTRYSDPAARTLFCMTSADGVDWSAWQRLAAIDEGHYQISALGRGRAGSAFNYHPRGKGLNWRTNLYYIETTDFGRTWRTAAGKSLTLPLTTPDNDAIVHDLRPEGLNLYLKDIRYDAEDRPVILFITSRGYQSGPRNDPRTWTTARWTGTEWDIRPAIRSDNNYDMGSLWIEDDGTWRIIGPTETGPQPYNPGGEVAMWLSEDRGESWKRARRLTRDSERNHTYVRRPVNAHPDFYALWADGHGREPSLSRLYFADREGNVHVLPREMGAESEVPDLLPSAESASLPFETEDHGDPGDRTPIVRPWKRVALDPEHGGHWVVTGDVDGDGAVDIVSARNVDRSDVHYTSAAVAQRLDGSVIWRWGDATTGRRNWHHDVACQIHDWDGDGGREVVLATEGFIVELEGASGSEKRRIPIPADATDCLVFADLSGKGRATDILVKTRYTQIWAYDASGDLLWTVENPGGARTAHQPLPIDIDGDGLDEILAGYALLDPDGSVRWKYESKKVNEARGHLDCARLLQRGATPAETRLVLTCCGANNIACIDGNGKVIWERSGHHFESIQVGSLFEDRPTPQILVDIDHRPRGESPLWVLDAGGKRLGQIMVDYGRHHGLLDWTGDGRYEILVADGHGVFDQRGRRIATFDTGGRGISLLLGDMTGDGVSDVTILTASPMAVHIFRNERGRAPETRPPLGCGVNFSLY